MNRKSIRFLSFIAAAAMVAGIGSLPVAGCIATLETAELEDEQVGEDESALASEWTINDNQRIVKAAAEPGLETDEPDTSATEQAMDQPGISACVPPHDVMTNDSLVWHGADIFGFSQNTLRGPRDCGGQRLSRNVAKTYGTGWCGVVDDWSDPMHPIFWANELCARNPNMWFWNDTITAACQEFYNGGSDLGDHDCRYIVHIGGPQYIPPFQPSNETQCQPSHVTRVPESCSPPPPLCPTGRKCCELSDDHTSCDLCWPKHLWCP